MFILVWHIKEFLSCSLSLLCGDKINKQKGVLNMFRSTSKCKSLAVMVLSLLVVYASSAFATGGLDLSGVTLDTSPIFAIALVIITAIAGIWAIKKVIRLVSMG